MKRTIILFYFLRGTNLFPVQHDVISFRFSDKILADH